MISQEIAISTPKGFKVRPVTKYIKTCRGMKSEIILSCKGKSCDSKSPSGLMSLALENGDVVTLSVNGTDAEKNFPILVDLLQKVGH